MDIRMQKEQLAFLEGVIVDADKHVGVRDDGLQCRCTRRAFAGAQKFLIGHQRLNSN